MNFKITLLLLLVLASFAQADLQACYDVCENDYAICRTRPPSRSAQAPSCGDL